MNRSRQGESGCAQHTVCQRRNAFHSLRQRAQTGCGVLIVLVLLASLPSPVYAEQRMALLIGNKAYADEVGPLKNPINDIDQVGAALRQLGFTVERVADAGLGETYRAVNKYVRSLRDAGDDAIGFFYYSGHGGANSWDKKNYLIPVDVRSADEEQLWDDSIRLDGIIDKLSKEASNATHFVVFDACRNELQLKKRGTKALGRRKGFQPERQHPGMLIAYATAPGELASDVGTGAGPYAKALAEELVKPGVQALVMFQNVQEKVRDTTGQLPWLSTPYLPKIYLAGGGDVIPGPPTPGPTIPGEDVETAAPRFSLRTLAGTGENRSFGDGGPATSAGLAGPFGITIAPTGIVYVGEKQKWSIRSVRLDGTMGTALKVDSSGQLSAGQRNGPNGWNDLIYVAGAFTHQVVVVDVTDGSAKVLAGTGREGFSGDNGPGTEAQLSWPTGLAVTNAGVESLSEIFVADTQNHRIRLVTLDGTIRTIAGNGTRGSWGDYGPARKAQLNKPTFLVYLRGTMGHWMHAPGELFIADTGNHKVRRIRLEDGEIVTVAGTGEAGYSGDGGPAVAARLNKPLGLAFDPEGNLYIADSNNHRIRRVDTDGVITTVAGTGRYGYSGGHRDAREAELYFPTGVVWDRGSFYVSDFGHNKVRLLSLGVE